MDAIIMAGGKGTRMLPLTAHTPKPLLLVQGKPILEWSLLSVRSVAERVLIVVNYMEDQITDYMQQQTIITDYLLVKQTPEPLGTGHALQCCEPFLHSSDFIVINGDDLFHPASIAELARKNLGIMVLEASDGSTWGVAITDDAGHLLRLHEKPPRGFYPEPVKVNIGAYKLNRSVFEYELALSPRGEYEITDYISYLASVANVELVLTDFWFPIGTPENLARAQHIDLHSHWIGGSRNIG